MPLENETQLGRMEQERRYVDLKMMAEKFWSKNGGGAFDERKYWAYGCHCYLLGDRPMSEMGIGSPVDALDNRCKAYKEWFNTFYKYCLFSLEENGQKLSA